MWDLSIENVNLIVKEPFKALIEISRNSYSGGTDSGRCQGSD